MFGSNLDVEQRKHYVNSFEFKKNKLFLKRTIFNNHLYVIRNFYLPHFAFTRHQFNHNKKLHITL